MQIMQINASMKVYLCLHIFTGIDYSKVMQLETIIVFIVLVFYKIKKFAYYIIFCSMGWLRLLYHCLMSHPEVAAEVAHAATPTCNLLNTCTSLLISPTAALYAAKIESVLLKLGLSSVEIGLALINNILRNQAQCTGRGK